MNNYKTVIIRPCDHPGVTVGDPCPYCGTTATSSSVAFEDASDNIDLIHDHAGGTVNVALNGRTFWKDGSWNTLCLPFALTSITGTPLAGATIRTLTGATFSNGVLTLTFGEAVTAIEAGKPYIVKWEKGNDSGTIISPSFQNVTIQQTTTTVDVTAGDVTFTGTFGPVPLTAGNKAKLYLGADNKLYYATSDLTVNSFRGYFVLSENVQPNAVSSLVLDFGEEPAGELNVVEE